MPGAAVRAVAVAALAVVAACSGSGGTAKAGPTGQAAARVVMTQCGEPPQRRPDVVQVICQTNDIIARHLA